MYDRRVSDQTDLFSDLVFVQLRMVDLVERRLREDGAPQVSSYLPLLAVSSLEAARVQDVARELGVSVGGASKAVDRLEHAGWVKRKPHPKDRRSATVSLTAAGRRQLAKAGASVSAALEEGVALPAARRNQLGSALTQLRQGFGA